jgi:hypothetical protein
MIFIIRFPVFLNRRDQMPIITMLCNRQTDTDGFLFICTCNYILGSCTGALFCTRIPPGSHFKVSDTRLLFSHTTNFAVLFHMKKIHSSFINKQQQKNSSQLSEKTSESNVSAFSCCLLTSQILGISLNIRTLVTNDAI